MAETIEMSGSFSKMSGKSAKYETMTECMANLLFRPNISKNIPNVRQLVGVIQAQLSK